MKWLRFVLLVMACALAINSTVSAEAELQSDKADAQRDLSTLPEWEMISSQYGGKLLLSDSPEIVPADGITYQDTINGDVRLFFHHVNGTAEPKKIVVWLENKGPQPAHITVYQWGLGGPGYNYVEVGKKVQMDYMKGIVSLYEVEVPANGGAGLVPSLEKTVVKPNMLVNGMYDFTTDQSVTVKVMMLPVRANIEKFAAQAKVLPTDKDRLRGTFAGKNRLLVSSQFYNPCQDGPVAFTLADNKIDKYLQGIDATDGSKVLNYGNYGVVYRLFLPSEYNGNIDYLLNPHGGEYAGAMGVRYRFKLENPVATPADRLSMGIGTSEDMSFIGRYKGGQSLWFTFSPPGASNLPVRLIMKPAE